MFLVAVTNIHLLSAFVMYLTFVGIVIGFCVAASSKEGWEYGRTKLPKNFFLAMLCTLCAAAAIFCVTPSTADVVIMNLRG